MVYVNIVLRENQRLNLTISFKKKNLCGTQNDISSSEVTYCPKKVNY